MSSTFTTIVVRKNPPDVSHFDLKSVQLPIGVGTIKNKAQQIFVSIGVRLQLFLVYDHCITPPLVFQKYTPIRTPKSLKNAYFAAILLDYRSISRIKFSEWPFFLNLFFRNSVSKYLSIFLMVIWPNSIFLKFNFT